MKRDRKTKPRKREQVASRISKQLKESLDMWAHSQRVSNSEAIRIAIENLVLPDAQKDEVIMHLEDISGTLLHMRREQVKLSLIRAEIQLLTEFVSTFVLEQFSSGKDDNNKGKFGAYLTAVIQRHRAKTTHSLIKNENDRQRSL